MGGLLSEDVGIHYIAPRPADPAVGGDTPTASTDMQGWDGVMFIVLAGVMTGVGSRVGIHVQSSADDGSSDPYVDIGSHFELAGAARSETAYVVDVLRPQKRWLRGRMTWNIANSAPNGIVAVTYRGRVGRLNLASKIPDFHGNVSDFAALQSP